MNSQTKSPHSSSTLGQLGLELALQERTPQKQLSQQIMDLQPMGSSILEIIVFILYDLEWKSRIP